MTREFCFVMEIRGSVRHLSGNRDFSQGEESQSVLISHDNSSLVVDTLCYQARERETTVTCFYFDFRRRKEQSVANVLGSLLKQIIAGLEEIPEEVSRAFRKQKMAIGGRGLQISDIFGMLQTVTSSLRTFICIDAFDECAVEHRTMLLDLLGQILQASPATRIFVAGRPHIRPEIQRRLAGKVVSVSISPAKADIITYLRCRLDEDETPEAMDKNLEAEILQKIPEQISEMCVVVMVLKIPSRLSANRYIQVSTRFLEY